MPGSASRSLQLRYRRCQLIEQPLVQQPLARERTLLRGKRLVLEGLQFRRDVALGILERLPAAIVVGNFLDVRVGDLDIEAVHAVVFDLEIGDARAAAFACFERHEKFAAVRIDGSQFVQFSVESGRYDAAIAHQRCGFGSDRPRKQRLPPRIDIEVRGGGLDERRLDRCRRRAKFGQAREGVA